MAGDPGELHVLEDQGMEGGLMPLILANSSNKAGFVIGH